eukprot:CAMPEP_0197053760 /NCGR_PEP_ID=MMETSP1384-20130603/27931_1 /TAXON_ID=29189 /ORGANISM="Ammonia sp." /LENGTH=537 /DNA_ID=CAMNT_0042486701 /DNA_START=1 /DNA_END=1614 /DNA_ORIENTATION=-
MLTFFDADIICFQETKITRDQLSSDVTKVKGYITFYSFCNTRNGYSGVSTYVREGAKQTVLPIRAQDGFTGFSKSNDNEELITNAELLALLKQSFDEKRLKTLDNEGRCLITDHKHFLLFNIYFPNGNASEERQIFKANYHECIKICLQYFICTQKRNVILVGDLNAKYQLVDSCDPGPPQEFFDRHSTKWFKSLVCTEEEKGLNMIDTFKHVHPDFSALDKKPYTCWDTYTFARASNYGTRIDYILVNQQMLIEKPNAVKVVDANVLQSVMGSDHCPISCELTGNQTQNNEAASIPKLASRFMPEFSGKQTNLMSFFNKDTRKRKFECISQDPNATDTVSGSQSSSSSSSSSLSGTERKRQKLNEPHTDKRKPKPPKRQSKKGKLDKTQSKLWTFVNKQQSSKGTDATNGNENTNGNDDEKLIDRMEKVSTTPSDNNKNGAVDSKPTLSKQSSAEQWKNLLGGKKKVPLCNHGEACVLRTVTKEGFNRGKKFYVCRRGKGAANDPNAQCSFFQWLDKPAKLKENENDKNGRKVKSW